jgi:outer membrane protein OmpA-like peptidoglycan-associated protein
MKRIGILGSATLLAWAFGGVLAAQTNKPTATKSLSDFKYQYKVGVLPFVDNTGSGGQDLSSALSRAVQAEIAHSTQLEGRVVKLDEGTNPEDVDSEKAVEIGRSHKVDAVLVGTVLDASSEQSDRSTNGPSIGGFNLGGSAHSVKAQVTLQGDLYNTTTGKQIDSIRVTGNASQTKVGANISSSLGDLSTGGNGFDKSPIGKALHEAVTDLVKKISGEQSKLMRYQPPASPPPPPADATPPPNPDNPPPEAPPPPPPPAPATDAAPEAAAPANSPAPSSSDSCAALAPSVFGSKQKTEIGMEGKIYFLPENAEKLPDFSSIKSEGSIYTDNWDIPSRDFTEGFPGVTNRFEWFAIDYNGSIYVPAAGKYTFRLNSDDGSKLYLDGRVVVDDDGVHGMADQSGDVKLTKGEHKFRLSYFQGPATGIGLQVFVTPPGGTEKIFRLQDFNKAVAESRSLLGVTEDAKEIHVQFGSEVLFDSGKYELKPTAEKSLTQLAQVLRSYPGYPTLIEGHTDNVGSAESNQTLSENRAEAVKQWLIDKGQVPGVCISTKGYGFSKPVASNDTAAGRQKNRRVEVHIQKPVATTPENN